MQQQTRKLVDDMRKIKDAIADISDRNVVMERLIREMAKKQKISADDVDERSFI